MDHIKGSQNQIDWKLYLKSGDRMFIGSKAAVLNALMDQLIAEQASVLGTPDFRENSMQQKSSYLPFVLLGR